jgi:uncharacterized protein YndB with AHSA1/START domain
MEHYRTEIRIEAPVEHVWAFSCDTSHWRDWMPRGTCSDLVGPIGQVGTTYVTTMKLMGHGMMATYSVVEVEPPRLCREHSDSGPMDAAMRFEPDGEATRLIVESDDEMPRMLSGFIRSLMTKGWMDRQMVQMLGDFRALAEATVPVPA